MNRTTKILSGLLLATSFAGAIPALAQSSIGGDARFSVTMGLVTQYLNGVNSENLLLAATTRRSRIAGNADLSASVDELLQRSYRALMDMGVDGVKTTIPYYAEILKSTGFRSARFDTGYVESHPELLNYATGQRRHDIAAALAAVIVAHAGL